MLFTKKNKKTKKRMLLKSKIIWIKIGQLKKSLQFF